VAEYIVVVGMVDSGWSGWSGWSIRDGRDGRDGRFGMADSGSILENPKCPERKSENLKRPKSNDTNDLQPNPKISKVFCLQWPIQFVE